MSSPISGRRPRYVDAIKVAATLLCEFAVYFTAVMLFIIVWGIS